MYLAITYVPKNCTTVTKLQITLTGPSGHAKAKQLKL